METHIKREGMVVYMLVKRKVEYWNIKMLEWGGAGDSSENQGEGEG